VRNILDPVKADFAFVIVEFRDRGELVSPNAHDQPTHLPGTTLERRRPGRRKRRSILSIGQEQEIGPQFARHLDRAEEARRDTAVYPLRSSPFACFAILLLLVAKLSEVRLPYRGGVA
jgi:hypothetical protein